MKIAENNDRGDMDFNDNYFEPVLQISEGYIDSLYYNTYYIYLDVRTTYNMNKYDCIIPMFVSILITFDL